MKKIILAFIILFISCPAILKAATYYVDPAGNDTSDGSSAHPFLTLQKAADTLTAAVLDAGGIASEPETVIVRAGTYSAGFVMAWDDPIKGTAANPIIFRAEEGVTITGRNNKTPDGINFEPDCAYVTIEGFTIINPSGGSITRAGIRVTGSDHMTIKNNVTGANGSWGIFTSHADNVLVENNEAYGSINQHGIYISNACVNPIVRGNLVYDNASCGIHMNGDLSMGEPGIITGALVEKNIIYNNGSVGGGGINMDGVQDSTVRNNLLYNNHASGITMYQIDGAAGPKNNYIYNNTIDMASNSRWALRLTGLEGAITIRNNILYNRNNSHGGISCDADADVALIDSDYNVFSASAWAATPDDESTTYTFSQWQSLGQDQHSLTAVVDDLFIDVLAGDYHLQTGSPAIDVGTSLGSFAVDIENAGRPYNGQWDIGAYEFGASPGVVPAVGASAVIVYPNPWKRGTAAAMNFTGLTTGSMVRIYSLAGELVRESAEQGGQMNWNGKNQDGEDIASGIYLWIVEETGGAIHRGKIAVLR